ncbi:MAG: hypothetical protein D6701_14200, partial [Gemmatimonadetes bacterium]
MTDTAPGQAFDPRSGVLPEVLEPGALLEGSGGGAVTLIVAGHDAPLDWAARCAVELARAWGDRGQRVFLADMAFEAPRLHTLLELDPAPGLRDVLAGRATLDDAVRPAKAGGFLFASAGGAEGDPEGDAESLWAEVLTGLREAQAVGLVFATAGSPLLPELATRAEAAVVLGEGEGLPDALVERVKARLAPPTDRAVAGDTPSTDAGPTTLEGPGPDEGPAAEAAGAPDESPEAGSRPPAEDAAAAFFGDEPSFAELDDLPAAPDVSRDDEGPLRDLAFPEVDPITSGEDPPPPALDIDLD